jgi:DNA-binding CsgD family transcriptional regulator
MKLGSHLVKRPLVLYGICMAGLLFLLRAVEYRYWVYDLHEGFLIGFLAVLFTALGSWIGWKLTRPRHAGSGGTVVPTTQSQDRVSAQAVGISPREEEVLKLIAAGHSNQEIADKLFLSLNTVKKHASTLFRKLEAERRTQAIEKARQMGLIE